MSVVTIFKNIHQTSTPFFRDIDTILQRIREGNSNDLIHKIRACKDDEQRNKLKRGLPSICFSGKFKDRQDGGIIEHSGYICLDFDKYPDNETMQAWRDKLINDKYTFALFTSPSGNGLKVIVRVPPEIENHKKYFDALAEYYNTDYFDRSTSNVSRVCYESVDENLYHNPVADVWTERNDDEHYDYSESPPVLPLRSESQIIQKLQKWFDGKFTMSKGNRNNNLFVFASALNEFGIKESEARGYLGQYVTDSFTDREVDRIVKSAYSKTDRHNTKFFEDNNSREKLKTKIKSGANAKQVYAELDSFTADEIDNAIHTLQSQSTVSEFWYRDDKMRLKISSLKFKYFLEQNGYCKFFPEGSDNHIFIKVENSFIENVSTQQIKDFVLDYVLEKKESAVYELLTFNTKLFKDDYLNLIKTEDIKLFEDTESYAMIYYRNCAVKVMRDKVHEIDYLNLNGMVWKHHVIDRDYAKADPIDCIFDKFITLVSAEDQERKEALMTTIGYLLHSYKTSARNQAIIFNDEKISENPNGGSGKGIICAAIGHVKRCCILDGKQFDFNKSFPYQTVSADTQTLIFDDVKKNFNFEALFSLITEGITLEKKNKDAIKIPVKKSPKIVITTNYTIGGVGGSFERRKHEVEMSSHFSPQHTPEDEFGMMLFDEFSPEEWNRFDSFMIWCIQEYLKHGLIKHEYKNLPARKFIGDTSSEFYEFVKDGSIEEGRRIYKSEKYNEFLEEYPDFKKWLSQKRFSKWIDNYGIHLGKEVEHGKDQQGRWALIGDDKQPQPINNKQDEIPF
ncbi:MAG: BT4734/BF3469 family protein [Bacteroidales bacterium]